MGVDMSINDEIFGELLTLGSAINTIRFEMLENLPEPTILALQSCNTTLSTRALEVLDNLITDAVDARIAGMDKNVPEREVHGEAPISSPLSTVPENTSSQPVPSDLAAAVSDTTPGA